MLVLHVFPSRPPPKWNYSLAQRYQRMKTLQDHRYSEFSVYRVLSPSVSESASTSHPFDPYVVCAACFPISPTSTCPPDSINVDTSRLSLDILCVSFAVAVFSGPSLVRSSSSSLLHPAVSLCVHLPFLWAYLRPSCLNDCAYLWPTVSHITSAILDLVLLVASLLPRFSLCVLSCSSACGFSRLFKLYRTVINPLTISARVSRHN